MKERWSFSEFTGDVGSRVHVKEPSEPPGTSAGHQESAERLAAHHEAVGPPKSLAIFF